MSKVIAIDPDSHNLAWAVVEDGPKVLDLGIVRIDKKFKGKSAVGHMIWALQEFSREVSDWGADLLVVEGQEIYRGSGNKANPNGIIMIAQIAGAAAGLLREGVRGLLIPKPREWKNNVPKPIHQARILSRLGWAYKKTQGYSYPTGAPFNFKSSEWKHLVDAIGLAMWGLNKLD